jgi:hypothetical protein
MVKRAIAEQTIQFYQLGLAIINDVAGVVLAICISEEFMAVLH